MNNLYSNPVLNFAFRMQEKLDINEHKGHWQNYSFEFLIKRLKEELEEVEQAISKNKSERCVIDKCADVANFMMMIADNYKED